MLPSSNELSPLAEPEPKHDVLTSVANVIEFPVRHDHDARLEHDLVLALATADDLASGMARVADRIRRTAGAAGVEWWARNDDGAVELIAATGTSRGTRHSLPLANTGQFVVHGGSVDPRLRSALLSLAPIVRRRAAEERLARTTVQLARRNEALEDFAALVAHELKTPLQGALVADDPSSAVEQALDLVDSLLEAAQNEPGERTFASVAESLDQVVADLRSEVEVTTDTDTTMPLPPEPLRVILRNLLSNAVAAGARHVHVAAVPTLRSWRLLVDDDGVGLAETDGYAAGSGLGLSLCRRIAARFGGVLDLDAGPSGGTRATLEFARAA
jgi:signal transduction histidine kinase